MPRNFTVEVINKSGNPGKFYNLFSAKAAIEGGGNTASTTKSVTWFVSRKLGDGGHHPFRYDDSLYGFLGTTTNTDKLANKNKVDTVINAGVTVGSDGDIGTILVVDESSAFHVVDQSDDDSQAPGEREFKIMTKKTSWSPNDYLIGVARGKSLGAGVTPAPTDVVGLKPGATFTIKTDLAVYVKASNFPEGTIQASPEDTGAFKVVFPPKMRKATVTEDNNGNFSVTYSPSSD